VDNCLDGHTYVESDLTTPESMDAFRMMREAVDNGMEYLVMEVSSQAYKVDRVFGLTFDVAAFLNISPDHISPIEHPTFEDYLHCKRQIVKNCRAYWVPIARAPTSSGRTHVMPAFPSPRSRLAAIPRQTSWPRRRMTITAASPSSSTVPRSAS
jgi:UDP-N-acetylmuramoylalanine-D-glutamate ligase